ncbi:uncharacterized protein GIQ15_06400 [Arthroderma uncinatum]|uniref:uncharacterized protein n=1 Tax=Arthroderma uncinatum TaxID=74035 RepID=UPI00144A5E6A|nr:uncharacterized protein GIQ15_06400 [Arthroderma uncinatum]KAF3479424.1 hypothetical protein GIQ15_06400 [Arthroderma uncinatum]
MAKLRTNMQAFLWLITLFVGLTLANVEKTMFISPNLDEEHSALLNIIDLKTLSPSAPSIREHLEAEFPTAAVPSGRRSWFRLDGLVPGQRYEVRVCWVATQPTAFALSTYEPSQIARSPKLMSSMTQFAESKGNDIGQRHPPSRETTGSSPAGATLFLVIDTAADYFTANQSLMANAPPVLVDIILDPYIFNILPTSLVPTLGYIAASAILAWFLSQYIWLQFSAAADVLDSNRSSGSEIQPQSVLGHTNWIGSARKKDHRIDFFSC